MMALISEQKKLLPMLFNDENNVQWISYVYQLVVSSLFYRNAMSLGHLSEFGQYISELDIEQVPDLDKKKGMSNNNIFFIFIHYHIMS